MPSQKKKSALYDDLGTELTKAHEAVAEQDVDYGSGGELPAGIENGIARLKECKFARYKSGTNEGKWYFLATGVVVFPDKAPNGEPITNRSTMIMEPLCDTPTRTRKKIGDHWAWIRNELLKLGADKKDIDPKNPEKTAASLKKARPYFGFRTWQGDKTEIENRNGKIFVGNVQYKSEAAAKAAHPFAGREPMIQQIWKGTCDPPEANPDVPEEAMGAVVDSPAESEPATEVAEPESVDLDALATDADDNQSKDAGLKLQELALEAGISQEAIDNAPSWAAVAEAIQGAGGESEGTEDEETSFDDNEEPNWEALGEDADAEVEDAIETLDTAGREAGLDPDKFETWGELAAALASGNSSTGSSESEDWMLMGNVVGYRGKTPGGKLSAKIVEVEITANDDGVFSVRNLDTGAEVEGVGAEQLSQLE